MIFSAADHPFSWSLRRRRLWQGCRRGYFLTYYAARGGFSPDAPQQVREAHRCKALLNRTNYRRRLLGDELHRSFYRRFEAEDEATSAAGFGAALLRRFRREFHAMLRGEPERDHKLPMLLELLEPGFPAGRFAEEFEQELRDCATELEHGLLPALERYPFACRRPIASPLPVRINELTAYATPLLAVVHAGELRIFENGPAEDETALLHKFHALNEFSLPPERVQSCRIDFDARTVEPVGAELNISAALKRIRNDADEMLGVIRPDGTVAAEDFPADRTRCENCIYKSCCPPDTAQ